MTAAILGKLGDAARWFEEGLVCGRSGGDEQGTARAFNNLATVRRLQGDHSAARMQSEDGQID